MDISTDIKDSKISENVHIPNNSTFTVNLQVSITIRRASIIGT